MSKQGIFNEKVNLMIIFDSCLAKDYRRPVRKSLSLHSRKSTPTPKFLDMAKAYFVCHISPNFHISFFIGCPQSVTHTFDSGSFFTIFVALAQSVACPAAHVVQQQQTKLIRLQLHHQGSTKVAAARKNFPIRQENLHQQAKAFS